MTRGPVLAWASYLALALALQFQSGVLTANLSGADEASHFLNGLMARDYVLQGAPSNPLAYAREYYLHYPKVAIGHWPPGFTMALAAWMLPLPPGPAAAMSLIAMLMALFGAMIYAEARRGGGDWWIAWAAGLLALISPLGRASLDEVMVEPLCAVLVFRSAILYARYLDTGATREAVWFGLWAAAAMLVKPNAAALALLPPLCVLIARRWDLPRRASFWIPAAIVLAVAGPWYAWSWRWLENEWVPGVERSWWIQVGRVARIMPWQGGMLTYLLIALGAAGWAMTRRKAPARSAAFASLAIAVLILHTVVSPHWETRHYLPALAPALVAGAWVLARLPRPAAAGSALALLALCGNPALAPKLETGMTHAADSLLGERGVWLVSSDSSGEGAFLTQVALHEARPRSHVLRASKMLADQTWLGHSYRQRFSSAEELASALDRWPVGAVVVDESGRVAVPHHARLREALSLRAEWKPAFRSPNVTVWKRATAPALDDEFRRELAERLSVAWR